MRAVVCWKWAPQRVEVDPLTAAITIDPTAGGASPADHAALSLALTLADHVTVITAGAAATEPMLREALAAGAARAVRCPGTGDESSAAVAAALAAAVEAEGAVDLVLCGDYSTDRASGAVPAFLAAQLGVAQALGAVKVARHDGGSGDGHVALAVERRLDQGRRERLLVRLPAVVSVEGALARLPRAALDAVLAARHAPIVAGPAVVDGAASPGLDHPYRPRPQPRPAPLGSPLQRIVELTAATTEREPPRVLHLDPPAAAEAIVDQLRAWGYLAGEGRG
jgi:electron transfer flavoprotein beta subunit